MLIGVVGSAFGDRSIQVEDNNNRQGWPRLPNRGDRFIEAKITVIKGKQIRDFDYWPLNTVPLSTSSTVFFHFPDCFFTRLTPRCSHGDELSTFLTFCLFAVFFFRMSTIKQRCGHVSNSVFWGKVLMNVQLTLKKLKKC